MNSATAELTVAIEQMKKINDATFMTYPLHVGAEQSVKIAYARKYEPEIASVCLDAHCVIRSSPSVATHLDALVAEARELISCLEDKLRIMAQWNDNDIDSDDGFDDGSPPQPLLPVLPSNRQPAPVTSA